MPPSHHQKLRKRSHRPLILVSNDDGIYASGIQTLIRALKRVGKVIVVAPDQQRSASSHSLTLHKPLRVTKVGPLQYAVNGTPTDCMNLAINKILTRLPDLVVSGINHGTNLGEDVHYSGTVSAAVEGGILGIPSIAVSVTGHEPFRFEPAAAFVAKLARRVLKEHLPEGIILNVNVPNVSQSRIRGYAFTIQGKRDYGDIIIEKIDPRGHPYFWIGGNEAGVDDIPHSDGNAIRARKISITPLRVDMTDRTVLERISTWKL
ncbi:MAG: 5'/3'-nucleotidase SurE [Deltaproteobacteria bacterium]|nr:5'/3'-nucleotidase SurE [Deltaproteobacteria bacterium]